VKGLVEAGGRTTLQRVNREAVRRDQSFSSRQYGAGSPRTLLMTYGIFDITPIKSAIGIIDYEVRLKPGYEELTD
jgi:hypothetical protein